MSERVESFGPVTLGANLTQEGPLYPSDEAMCSATLDIFPNTSDQPRWLKHLRIYEHAPALSIPSALDVLGDALEVGDRGSVDEVIREIGIVGCWRPSTILVQRVTDYNSNFLVVSDATIAHALWNVDIHRAVPRNSPYRIELLNDEPRPRKVRVSMTMVDMTAAEMRGESDDRVEYAFTRIDALERAMREQKKDIKTLTVALAKYRVREG